MSDRIVNAAICSVLAAAAGLLSGRVASSQMGPPSGDDLVFVTEDRAPYTNNPGCDAISVFRSGVSEAVHRGETNVSPGRLAVSDDLLVALATQSNTRRFVYALSRTSPDSSRWSSGTLTGAPFASLGGIALVPGGGAFLAATESSGIMKDGRDLRLPNLPPYYVKRYGLPTLGSGERRVGRLQGTFRTDGVAVDILLGNGGSLAHILTNKSVVHSIDSATMQEVAPAIPQAALEGPASRVYEASTVLLHGTLTSDDRYLVSNRWVSGEINIADLAERRSVVVATGMDTSGGVAVNHGWINRGLLAVHGGSEVRVLRILPGPSVETLASARVNPPDHAFADETGPLLSIAWNGSGSEIIAATDDGAADFAVFSVLDGGNEIRPSALLVACKDSRNYANDIVTSNGLLEPPSPSPSPSPSALPSPTASMPPSATPSIVTTGLPTVTATATPTTGGSATPSHAPIYMPLALREQCESGKMTADVALVIDTSTSMRDDRTQVGRTKLSAAVEAASGFIDAMSMPRDQAAVLIFNEDAHVLQGLTGRRADVKQALREIPHRVRELTRIDLGIEAGHIELMGANRTPQNRPVMIVLTDGLSNPVPASVAVRKALDAQRDGITIFTIGLGTDDELNVPELREMASKPEYFFHAPDGEDLRAIYREIAAEIPCPAEEFWGSR